MQCSNPNTSWRSQPLKSTSSKAGETKSPEPFRDDLFSKNYNHHQLPFTSRRVGYTRPSSERSQPSCLPLALPLKKPRAIRTPRSSTSGHTVRGCFPPGHAPWPRPPRHAFRARSGRPACARGGAEPRGRPPRDLPSPGGGQACAGTSRVVQTLALVVLGGGNSKKHQRQEKIKSGWSVGFI